MDSLSLFQSTWVLLSAGRNEMEDSKEMFQTVIMREVKNMFMLPTLQSLCIFRLSLSSVSLLTLPGKDPLQPLKEAQGKASHCHRIPDQDPILHRMTA